MRFNAPPNWPQPPAGWVPPAGWQPDPTWGPAPAGWQLWVDDSAFNAAPSNHPPGLRSSEPAVNGLAIASLALSIVSLPVVLVAGMFVIIVPLAGIVVGALGLRRAKQGAGLRGLAIAGICVGALSSLIAFSSVLATLIVGGTDDPKSSFYSDIEEHGVESAKAMTTQGGTNFTVGDFICQAFDKGGDPLNAFGILGGDEFSPNEKMVTVYWAVENLCPIHQGRVPEHWKDAVKNPPG